MGVGKIDQEPLSEQETMTIVRGFYLLSQGFPILQGNIIEYASGVLAKKDRKIDEAVFLDVCTQIREHMLQRMIQAGTHRDRGSLSGEKKQVEEVYLPRIRGQDKTDELVPDIARTMFLRDKKFLKEGIANKRETGRKFLEYYGRDGNNTGHAVLDSLMKKVWVHTQAPKNACEYYDLERES